MPLTAEALLAAQRLVAAFPGTHGDLALSIAALVSADGVPVMVARTAAVCLAKLLQQEKVQASGLLGALGQGACSPDPQVGALMRRVLAELADAAGRQRAKLLLDAFKQTDERRRSQFAEVLLADLLGPDDLCCEALAAGALQCFCAAGSQAASAAASTLLCRLMPTPPALQPLEAHLADGRAAALSSADAAALRAFVGNLFIAEEGPRARGGEAVQRARKLQAALLAQLQPSRQAKHRAKRKAGAAEPPAAGTGLMSCGIENIQEYKTAIEALQPMQGAQTSRSAHSSRLADILN
ncbi:hypothetical protein WJX81_004235 [Elliptochloris bilobata]|uniref:Uncharacterized protein n=1 Tax=Elliptochloris bilobata TaxID=381761 RepID=A0AAW1QXY2_9CHLO